MAYILEKYPDKTHLSNARVTKMIYLADWRHAITDKKQITNIRWYFDNYGPYVWDIKEVAEANPDLFTTIEGSTAYGNPKLLLEIIDNKYIPNLSEEEKKTLDHVIAKTKDLSWSEFIRLIYSTYPIITSERYSYLDLCEKAKDYLRTSE